MIFAAGFAEVGEREMQDEIAATARDGGLAIVGPTGSGKTLAAFLASLDALFRKGIKGDLPNETQVVYVSPLKALSNDIRKNLQEPLVGSESRPN